MDDISYSLEAKPEPSRTMAYKTRKTVNRLERKQLHNYESCGARTTTGEINLHIEQENHKLGQIAARNIRMSVDICVAFLK